MLKRCKAPPENMLNMPSSVPFWVEKKAANLAASMPGTGMKVPIRYTMSAPTRNNSRLRISAKRVIYPRAAAGLVADVATSFLLSLEFSARGLNGALRALGRGNDLVFDGERLGHLARHNDLHDLGVLGHQIRFDQSGQRDFGAGHAHEVRQGQ